MKRSRLIQISVQGGSGSVPSGALQFQDDWPGLWLRGDDAIALLVDLELMCEQLRQHGGEDYLPPVAVAHVMDVIRNDVKVSRED